LVFETLDWAVGEPSSLRTCRSSLFNIKSPHFHDYGRFNSKKGCLRERLELDD
jgi:hypothetical protein